jgi:hypothetical protein
MEAAYELSFGVGDDDADVDAIHADANIWRCLARLLRDCDAREQEQARRKKNRDISRRARHEPIEIVGRRRKRQKPCSAKSFQNAEQGFSIFIR